MREWPLEPAWALKESRFDGSDIRTVMEQSRCYHVIALARAFWSTGRQAYLDTFRNHIDSWIVNNPVGYGPNWLSPMDAAIRAANWVIGAVLFATARQLPLEFWHPVVSNLIATGHYISTHLEWHPIFRGNHYIANAVGLCYLGTFFRDTRLGRRWLNRSRKILLKEIEHQVTADGVSFEKALAYHRLVTEFFTYAGDLLLRNGGTPLTPGYQARLDAMYTFIGAYLPPSGNAPMLGDADDGRLHALSAHAILHPRRHDVGLPRALPNSPVVESQAFPQGGFYVLRAGYDHAVIRCGAVGLKGAGSHDHNDQLSYELTIQGRRIVADSGTYTYLRDLARRHSFRTTAAHSVVQVAGHEQNPIIPAAPWRVLHDRTRARCLCWTVSSAGTVFEGCHWGYAHLRSKAVCFRRMSVDHESGRWEVKDVIHGDREEQVTWRLHLAPTRHVRQSSLPGEYALVLPGSPTVLVELRATPDLRFDVIRTPASNRYGVVYQRPCLVLSGTTRLPTTIVVTFVRASTAPG